MVTVNKWRHQDQRTSLNWKTIHSLQWCATSCSTAVLGQSDFCSPEQHWLTDWQRSAYVARSTIFIWLKHVFECYEKTICEPMAFFLKVHVVHFSKRRSVFSHLSAWRTLQKTGTCWWMVIWSQELTTQWPLWSQASIQQVASKVLIALGLWCNLSTSQLS